MHDNVPCVSDLMSNTQLKSQSEINFIRLPISLHRSGRGTSLYVSSADGSRFPLSHRIRQMKIFWTPENNQKLLLMVIQNHFAGAPNYQRLVQEWGSEISEAAIRIQFNKLRREGATNGRITKAKAGASKLRVQAEKRKDEDDSKSLHNDKVEKCE